MRRLRALALWVTAVLSVASAITQASGCAAGEVKNAGSGGQECLIGDEVCDGEDNDCDGDIDEGCQCLPGEMGPCYSGASGTKEVGVCIGGQAKCGDEGLWGECVGEVVPSAEACDGVDNNCDGMVDEGCECSPPTAATTRDCYTGVAGTQGVGACHAGTQSCTETGVWGKDCVGEVKPSDETCDTLDNDCNGQVDDMGTATCGFGACEVTVVQCTDGVFTPCVPQQPDVEVCDGVDNDCDMLTDEVYPEKDKVCVTGLGGVCAAGKYDCVAGVLKCIGNAAPSTEICDGIDNDCDGVVDDNILGTGGECSTGLIGACSAGKITCKNNQIDCFPLIDPGPEVCDGVDNDCNGMVDDGNLGSGLSCNTGQPGACSAGKMSCVSGAIQCAPNLSGTPESCDGLDNNCNEIVDEGNPGGGAPCVTGLPGACAAGTTHCLNGLVLCVQSSQPKAEVCNGLDDDCNGLDDDGNLGGGAACNTGLMGVCAAGTMSCVLGSITCKQDVQASPENCTNGLDDDCNGTGDPPSAVYFEETFAGGNANGWTLDGWWQIGAAMVSVGQTTGNPDPGSDHTTPGVDTMLAGVIIGGNAPKVAHAMSYLTSPAINLSGAAGSVYLEYWRWLNSGVLPYMVNAVDVYDGSAWVNLWTTGAGPAVADSAWQRVSFDVTAHKSATFRVRFGFSIPQVSGMPTVSSWNVDDVKLSSIPCP